MCDEVSTRLRDKGFNALNVSITIKTADFKYFGDSSRLPFYTSYASDLVNAVMKMTDKFWKYNTAVRAIRVCTFNLSEASKTQLCMFSNEIKNYALNTTIDEIRHKYGYSAIMPASTIKNSHLNLEKIE